MLISTGSVLTCVHVNALIRNGGIRRYKENERALGHLSLVDLIKLEDMKANVRVIQSEFGNLNTCSDPSPEETARLMFATFLDPVTLHPSCGAFKRNADACYSKTLWIGCDPKTKIATIDVYIRDESYDNSMTTDNPQIGRCGFRSGELIKRAKKFTQTFDCRCSDSIDECPEGTYCTYSPRGYECKPYAKLGSYCGLNFEEGLVLCKPGKAFCFNAIWCYYWDSPGICIAYMGECKSDSDCRDPSRMYCDQSEGKCKHRLKLDDCCFPKEDLCSKGLVCITKNGVDICQQSDVSIVQPLEICNNQVCGGLSSPDCECTCNKGSPVCTLFPTELCDPATSASDCGGVCECKGY